MRDQENIAPIDQYIIDFVRELRIKKKLSQDDIAAVLGIKRSFIGNVESPNNRAKYNVSHINALADYFGMSPQAFLPAKPLPVEFSEKDEKKEVRQAKKVGRKKK